MAAPHRTSELALDSTPYQKMDGGMDEALARKSMATRIAERLPELPPPVEGWSTDEYWAGNINLFSLSFVCGYLDAHILALGVGFITGMSGNYSIFANELTFIETTTGGTVGGWIKLLYVPLIFIAMLLGTAFAQYNLHPHRKDGLWWRYIEDESANQKRDMSYVLLSVYNSFFILGADLVLGLDTDCVVKCHDYVTCNNILQDTCRYAAVAAAFLTCMAGAAANPVSQKLYKVPTAFVTGHTQNLAEFLLKHFVFDEIKDVDRKKVRRSAGCVLGFLMGAIASSVIRYLFFTDQGNGAYSLLPIIAVELFNGFRNGRAAWNEAHK